jgi:NAD-dependent dihydropyrimidine dehydrogenase PreA subunit
MKRPAISASMKLEALKAGQVQAACYICKRVCPWDQFHFDHIQALVRHPRSKQFSGDLCMVSPGKVGV